MNLKRHVITAFIVLSAVLGFQGTFAQTPEPQPQNPPAPTQEQSPLPENGFFGINLGLMLFPVGLDGGYNFKDFGIRVSLDIEYSALEGYARFRLGQDSSYWYAGGGGGYSLISSQSSYFNPPFGVNALIGLQTELGFFIEYQPFALFGFFVPSNNYVGIGWLLSAVHIKVGWRFFF